MGFHMFQHGYKLPQHLLLNVNVQWAFFRPSWRRRPWHDCSLMHLFRRKLTEEPPRHGAGTRVPLQFCDLSFPPSCVQPCQSTGSYSPALPFVASAAMWLLTSVSLTLICTCGHLIVITLTTDHLQSICVSIKTPFASWNYHRRPDM